MKRWGTTTDPDTGRHRAGGEGSPPRLVTTPAMLRDGRVGVSAAAVMGMVLTLLLVVGVFGVRVWWAQHEAQGEPVTRAEQAPHQGASAPSAAPPAPSAVPGERGVSTDEAAGASAAPLAIHVSGAVQSPGVVTVPTGSRVEDAVAAAGGASGKADLARINLARPLADGEQVWVPKPGDEPPSFVGSTPPESLGQQNSAGGDDAGQESTIDLNAADQDALETLPGVGPVTAERILAWRHEHGPFRGAEELLEVSGIGERTLENLTPHITW